MMLLQVGGAFHRGVTGDRDRPASLLAQHLALPEDLDRLVARAMDADLGCGHDAKAVLEADLRPRVEPEKVAQQVAEVPPPERSREAVGHPERAAEFRQPQ